MKVRAATAVPILERTQGTSRPGTKRECEATEKREAELEYGIGVPRTRGVVTPYAGLSLTDGQGRMLRTGARWQLAPEATLANRVDTGAGRRRERRLERGPAPRKRPLVTRREREPRAGARQ